MEGGGHTGRKGRAYKRHQGEGGRGVRRGLGMGQGGDGRGGERCRRVRDHTIV